MATMENKAGIRPRASADEAAPSLGIYRKSGKLILLGQFRCDETVLISIHYRPDAAVASARNAPTRSSNPLRDKLQPFSG